MTRKKLSLSSNKDIRRNKRKINVAKIQKNDESSTENIKTPSKSPLRKKTCPNKAFPITPLKESPSKGIMCISPSKSYQRKKCKYSVVHTKCSPRKGLQFNKQDQSINSGRRINFDDGFELHEDHENDQDNEINEIVKMLPTVLEQLDRTGLKHIIPDFFQLVAEGKFPLQNISFLLWCEIVQWFKLQNTSSMRYMDQTKSFWKLGMRHFGGKFVRFMTGFKNTSDVVFESAERGYCEPAKSDINFAVPSEQVLRNYNPYGLSGSKRYPGIYKDIMESVSNTLEPTSACLTFDGKKIKQGLTKHSGDVDLLGFEDGLSLSERKNQLKQEIELVEKLITSLNGKIEIKSSQYENERVIVIQLATVLSSIAHKVRGIKDKKEYARKKFIESSGDDWHKGRYVYVISALNAYLFEIDGYLANYMEILDEIYYCIASLSGSLSQFQLKDLVYLPSQRNYVELSENPDEQESRFVKQRSQKWHEIRKEAKVTGSTIYQALGFDGLKQQREHFDKVMYGIKPKEHTPEVLAAMEHGTLNEINAVATLVGKVLPVLYPDYLYIEEGCIKLSLNDKPFMVISPDGSLGIEIDGDIYTTSAVEFKCPLRGAHYEFPQRYYLQCLSTMESLDVDRMLYVSWTNTLTTVFEVERNKKFFEEALSLAADIYGSEKPKRPCKLHESVKVMKETIASKCAEVKFFGEFPSQTSSAYPVVRQRNSATIEELLETLTRIKQLLSEGYELQRQKASEALVFLCSDLDRTWAKQQLRWSPVCWFPKGYTLNTETMRRIMEKVLTSCFESGIHIPAVSFDGQWHNIAVRSIDNKPLTVLQLMKQTWDKCTKMKKPQVVKEYMTLNKSVIICKSESGKCVLTNNNAHLPKLRMTQIRNSDNVKDSHEKESEDQSVPIHFAVPEVVLRCSTEIQNIENLDELTPFICLETGAANEISECIVTEDNWKQSIEDQIADEIVVGEELLDQNNNETIGIENVFQEDWGQNRENDENGVKFTIDEAKAEIILKMLQTDISANKKGLWDHETARTIIDKCSSVESMMTLRDVDLKVIVRYLRRQAEVQTKVLESFTKKLKVDKLCEIFGYQNNRSDNTRKYKRNNNPKSLAELSSRILLSSKISKHAINISYAEFVWDKTLSKWYEDSPVDNKTKVLDTDTPEYWFYVPELSYVRNQIEVKCIDSSHLLTRTRRKLCKGGIESLTNKPWLDVARTKKTFLSPVMVEDITDPMSVPMALTLISENVENCMRENGDLKAANLCNDVRQWWLAEDEPGIPAYERIRMRASLRSRLLGYIDFGRFPPPTQYVGGWPIQLWEALIASMDSKVLLYALTKSGSYNVRAFSSLIGETFFSELTNDDKRGQGTVTVDEFSYFIGNSVEQMQARLDPERCFAYRTSRSTVYKLIDQDHMTTTSMQHETRNQPIKNQINGLIIPRNHAFDSEERRRAKGRVKNTFISMDRNSVQKGSLGVRWERSRINESKILPSRKIGLPE